MKKILFSLFIALTAVAFTGCEELFLGTEAIVGHTYEWESSNGRDELRIEFPIKPNSSQIMVKIKSFCGCETKPYFCWLLPSPFPKSPPEPIAMSPCSVCHAEPNGSACSI